MQNANIFFDAVKRFDYELEAWEKEIVKAEEYKLQLIAEKKDVRNTDYRIKIQKDRMAMVMQLIELANIAISEIPKVGHIEREAHNVNRVQIRYLPKDPNYILEDLAAQSDDNNLMLAQQAEVLQQILNKLK